MQNAAAHMMYKHMEIWHSLCREETHEDSVGTKSKNRQAAMCWRNLVDDVEAEPGLGEHEDDARAGSWIEEVDAHDAAAVEKEALPPHNVSTRA